MPTGVFIRTAEHCANISAARKGKASWVRHGHANPKSPTYESWAGMLSRCRNPNQPYYHRYGGRGITVCPRWHKFENFLEDMGERPDGLSLDRINNDGNYEPDNCHWATRQEQNMNSRHCPTCK